MWTDRQTNMTKVIVANRNFAIAPRKVNYIFIAGVGG